MDPRVIFNHQDNREDNGENQKPVINQETVFTPPICQLLTNYKEGLLLKKRGESAAIHVDEIASKLAKVYERVRKVIDWKEENVLRRSAILRILKRSLIFKISGINLAEIDTSQIAETLTLELIRGGHLPNDEVPREKIEVATLILSKYLYVLENAPFSQNTFEFAFKKKVNFYDWILEIAACEIEDVLALPFKENALIKAMTLAMTERIRILPKEALTDEEKKTLTYIATCRTLFDLDEAFISYHILTHQYPEWNNPSLAFVTEITRNIFNINKSIEKELNHPLSREFFNICERMDTVFTILGDLLDSYQNKPEEIEKVLYNREHFKELISQFYNKRIKTLKTRLFHMAVFSTLSVFVSNWFTFFIVEVPLANLFYEGFNFLAAAVDFILPSLVMFILVAIIKPPGKGNLEKVIEMTFKFVYQGDEKDIFEIKIKKKRRPIFKFIIILLYIFACLLTFGAIAWIFYIAKIPVTSVILDTMTIALNVFAALVIRNKARELTIHEKTTFWEFLLDVISLPVAEVGNFLANKWKEYNVVSVFFNFFIEMPFVSLIDFIENWSNFLKEKKADIH